MAELNYFGIATTIVIFASFFLPWWSIRASGVSIDIYPFGVIAWNVPSYDVDWMIDRLLSLDGAFLIVSLFLVASGVLALVGSLKIPLLLISPIVLNPMAAFIFYGLMRTAIGRLAHGPFSGTNLTPVGPWGFSLGIGLCILAGLIAPISLIPYYWKRHKQL
ncbi:MAG: hypothetical protein QXX08_05075 [Candidatus Bathyarchaeia archaeon]